MRRTGGESQRERMSGADSELCVHVCASMGVCVLLPLSRVTWTLLCPLSRCCFCPAARDSFVPRASPRTALAPALSLYQAVFVFSLALACASGREVFVPALSSRACAPLFRESSLCVLPPAAPLTLFFRRAHCAPGCFGINMSASRLSARGWRWDRCFSG